MKRAIILPALVTAFVALLPAGVAVADNPHDGTTGQPGKTASDDATMKPPGFSSPGFATAESHYANPTSTGGSNSGNTHVVSQYDVAGFQWCRHHTSSSSC